MPSGRRRHCWSRGPCFVSFPCLSLGFTDAAKNRHFEAARLSEKMGKCGAAVEFAERGLALDKDCLGEDHEVYQASMEVVQRLKRARTSGEKDETMSAVK